MYKVLGSLVIGLCVGGFTALLLMWAWNYVMPMFGLPELSFIKAWAVMFIANLLLGSVSRAQRE